MCDIISYLQISFFGKSAFKDNSTDVPGNIVTIPCDDKSAKGLAQSEPVNVGSIERRKSLRCRSQNDLAHPMRGATRQVQ